MRQDSGVLEPADPPLPFASIDLMLRRRSGDGMIETSLAQYGQNIPFFSQESKVLRPLPKSHQKLSGTEITVLIVSLKDFH
jgi:hypothetical protein